MGPCSVVNDRFCAIKCNAPDDGQFSYLEYDKSDHNLSSLYQCGLYNGNSNIYYHFGKNTFISINMTKTTCSNPCYRFLRTQFKINFCCFISNGKDEMDFSIMNHGLTSESFIKKSIYKNNTAIHLIDCEFETVLYISECIFIQNKVEYVFSYFGAQSFVVINCTGDNLTVYSDNINTDQMKTDPFSITFTHISLGECNPDPLFYLGQTSKINHNKNYRRR